MGQRVDFGANAPIYDRRHGAALSADVARSLCSAGALGRGARVLDVGAGTGRVSIALADLGCDVVAVDPSVPMLSALRSKSANTSIPIVAAEGAHLPFRPESFDVVIFARILYVIADWKASLREAFHTIKAGGLLFHEWGNGGAAAKRGFRSGKKPGACSRMPAWTTRSILAPVRRATSMLIFWRTDLFGRRFWRPVQAPARRSGIFLCGSRVASCRTFGRCQNGCGRTACQS